MGVAQIIAGVVSLAITAVAVVLAAVFSASMFGPRRGSGEAVPAS